ncbi:hypothetical protein LWI28_011083 [Acer negundo]|uniref:Uncharacterized protein n=1 Tax=Acer negundo TaxID=4023 RepID=A0AAD5IAB7_ACENE|nr:hypothetical protein LWI28_011083 [Acer negundo]
MVSNYKNRWLLRRCFAHPLGITVEDTRASSTDREANACICELMFWLGDLQGYGHSSGWPTFGSVGSRMEGWNATTKKFTAPEEVWEDYFKSHLTYRGLHNKNCNDYEDLQIVIRNATATRKNSLGLGDETDARTFGVEDRQTALDDFIYDETNEAFVTNQNDPSHQPLTLGQSSSPLPFFTTSFEVHLVSTSQKKRTRTDNEGNNNSTETNQKAVIIEKISLTIDSIATDFRGVYSLLEKQEKDRIKSVL